MLCRCSPERTSGRYGCAASVAVATWLARWEGELESATASLEATALSEDPEAGAAQGSEDQRTASSISDSIAVKVVPCQQSPLCQASVPTLFHLFKHHRLMFHPHPTYIQECKPKFIGCNKSRQDAAENSYTFAPSRFTQPKQFRFQDRRTAFVTQINLLGHACKNTTKFRG